MTGHLRLLACNGHCAIALLPAQQLLGINSSPIQNGEYRESPVVGVVLESVYHKVTSCEPKIIETLYNKNIGSQAVHTLFDWSV